MGGEAEVRRKSSTKRWGSADAFAVGSFTTVEDGAFQLVRLNEETFIGLSWRDSHIRHCAVPWKPDFVWPDPDTCEQEQ